MIRGGVGSEDDGGPRTLLCVLSNPPVTDGARTRARVELIGEMFGATSVLSENLFPVATYRSGGVAAAGADASSWLPSRSLLEEAIVSADAVLLAYGLGEPSGPARGHHRAQLLWLASMLDFHKVASFVVGDGPRHPSRWQRWTSRQYPGIAFSAAVRASVRPFTIPTFPDT